jgi:hypothetical protein
MAWPAYLSSNHKVTTRFSIHITYDGIRMNVLAPIVVCNSYNIDLSSSLTYRVYIRNMLARVTCRCM